MGLVAPVDGDEVGGQRFDLARVAEPSGIDATRPRDRAGELTDHRDGFTVLAHDQHVVCEVLDRWVIEEDSTDGWKAAITVDSGSSCCASCAAEPAATLSGNGPRWSKPSGLTQSTTILPASSVASEESRSA